MDGCVSCRGAARPILKQKIEVLSNDTGVMVRRIDPYQKKPELVSDLKLQVVARIHSDVPCSCREGEVCPAFCPEVRWGDAWQAGPMPKGHSE